MATNFLHNFLAKLNYQVTLSDTILDSVHCKLIVSEDKNVVQCRNLQKFTHTSRRLFCFNPVVLDSKGYSSCR